MKVARVDTWAAGLKDKPGNLAGKLKALAGAGANLEFIIARRTPEQPGRGVVFVTPIRGAKAARAARKEGFKKTTSLHTVRIEGPDRRGVVGRLTAALAEAGVNLRGLSAAAIGGCFIAHIAVDTGASAAKAVRVLKGL